MTLGSGLEVCEWEIFYFRLFLAHICDRGISHHLDPLPLEGTYVGPNELAEHSPFDVWII